MPAIAAVYPTLHAANAAVARIAENGEIEASRLAVLGPLQRRLISAALAADTDRFGRILLRAHVTGAACGLLLGMVVVALGVAAEMTAITASVGAGALGFGLAGVMLGSLVAGLLALRLRHDTVADCVARALERGRWAVVARAASLPQAGRIAASLEKTGGAGCRIGVYPTVRRE